MTTFHRWLLFKQTGSYFPCKLLFQASPVRFRRASICKESFSQAPQLNQKATRITVPINPNNPINPAPRPAVAASQLPIGWRKLAPITPLPETIRLKWQTNNNVSVWTAGEKMGTFCCKARGLRASLIWWQSRKGWNEPPRRGNAMASCLVQAGLSSHLPVFLISWMPYGTILSRVTNISALPLATDCATLFRTAQLDACPYIFLI